MKNNPFDKYRRGFDPTQKKYKDLLHPTTPTTPENMQARTQDIINPATPVALPKHLFIPESAQSVDIRRVATIPLGSSGTLMTFTAPQSVTTRFISYGVFSDALLEADIAFIPKVNGNRIFPFHGDPTDNFKIGLGLAPDLSNSALISCQLNMNPGDILTWDVVNNSVVDTVLGVRMVGYVDTTQRRVAARFGG